MHVLEASKAEVDRSLDEGHEVLDYCAGRLAGHTTLATGLLNPNFGPVLYAATRLLKPEVVVETGVASGISSLFILSALERNAAGRLHSIDLPSADERLVPKGMCPGWVVPGHLAGRWELRLGDARVELPAVLYRLGGADMFFHDSDHSHAHMLWELVFAYSRLNAGGAIVADDTTSQTAWSEFVQLARGGKCATINRVGLWR